VLESLPLSLSLFYFLLFFLLLLLLTHVCMKGPSCVSNLVTHALLVTRRLSIDSFLALNLDNSFSNSNLPLSSALISVTAAGGGGGDCDERR